MIKNKKFFKILCTLLCCLVLINTLSVGASATGGSSVPSATNLVAGLGYTVSPAASSSYPDTGNKELTDGVYGPADLHDAAWQGIQNGNPITIEFTLPETKNITGIKANFLHSSSSGIYVPNSEINMYVSSDNATWTLLKKIKPDTPTEEVTTKSYEWTLGTDGINGNMSQTTVSAQYVKVEIKSTLEWVFIDEIEVLGNDVSVTPDPNAPKNLASGLSVTTPGAIGYYYSTAPATTSPDSGNKLTDGINGSIGFWDGKWVGLYSSDSSLTKFDVTFNLGDLKSVSSVSANFLKDAGPNGSGISLPGDYEISVSDDGNRWASLKKSDISDITADGGTSKVGWNGATDKVPGDTTNATMAYVKYVKVSFTRLSSWCFIDEIEILGFDGQQQGAVSLWTNGGGDTNPDPNTPINLASGLSVTTPGAIGYYYSTAPSNTSSDSGNKLTDSIYGSTGFWDGKWVGFYSTDSNVTKFDAVFNLGDFKSVSSVSANFLKDAGPNGSGISLPGDYEISVSDDGNRWASLKKSDISDITTDGGTSKVGWNGATDKIPGDTTNATMAYVKYVKVSFTRLSSWCFIDEIEIFGFDGQQQGAVSLWTNGGGDPTTDPDPNAPHNLALGKDYTVTGGQPASQYADSGKELTDGKLGTTNYQDAEWQGHSGGETTRTFVFDLGTDCSISEITTNFLFDAGLRILYPGKYDISVSQDGQSWSTLPSDIMFVNPEKSPVIFKADWIANNNITPNEGMTDAQVYGRYVKIVTGTAGWTFLDEVEIIGQTGKTAAAVTLIPDSAVVKDYLKAGENTAGIKNLLLAYNGFYASGVGDWSKEDFIPYVSYVDEAGTPKDTFFDGILMLGLRNPGGRSFGGTNTITQASYKADWVWYLNKTFGTNGDLNSLNEATKEVGGKLGKPGLKEKVVIAIPYPDPIQLDFGDVDGDGISECLNPTVDPVNAVANQKKVVKWYIDTLLAKWNASGYSNLELSGLYWLEEGVNKGDVEKYASSLTHANNLKMFWIPWFGATGYQQWKRFGFDAVAYQPNHTFDGTTTDRLIAAAVQAKEYGMGIELELDAPAVDGNSDKYKRYIDYLDFGVKEGYMGESGDGSYRAYYQDVKALKTAAESITPKTRFLYDATYNFTRGTYKSGYVQYLNKSNETYFDLLDVNDALADIAEKLADDSITPEDKAFLESEQVKVTAIKTDILNMKSYIDSITIPLTGITSENVTMDDYEKLDSAIESIKALLDGKNLTPNQRDQLEDLQVAFAKLTNVSVPGGSDGNTNPGDTGSNNSGDIGNKEQKPVVTTTQPEIEGNTALTLVDGKELDKAFGKAIPSEDGKKIVAINVNAVNGVAAYTQRLPIAAISSNAIDKKIQINTAVATVTLPENMLNAQDVKDASTAELSIGTVDTAKLSDAVKQQIGNRPIIELNLKVDGKALAWKNLSAPVTISIDYQPTAEELKNPDHIVVLYIDEAGKVVTVPSGRYDKATGKVTFTTTHFSKYAVAFVNKTFNDISKYTWAVKPVEVLSSKGVIEGTTENTFSPGKNITRGDYLVWLVKALGLTAQFDTNFNDVKTTDKYYEALGIAKKLGITAGTGSNNFSPEKEISRQDMMVLTVKALKIAKFSLKNGTSTDVSTYSDFSKIANYAVNDVATMVKSGLIAGTGKNCLSPIGTTTRAEASVILYKIYTTK